jgi:hypothetical protein
MKQKRRNHSPEFKARERGRSQSHNSKVLPRGEKSLTRRRKGFRIGNSWKTTLFFPLLRSFA